MGRVALILLLGLQCLVADENPVLERCTACHERSAPPLSLIYRRYLMLYSSKARIRQEMVDFLSAPSKEKSAMPEGMKNRFNPQNHPAFSPSVAKEAVERLIKKEDLIPHIVVPKDRGTPGHPPRQRTEFSTSPPSKNRTSETTSALPSPKQKLQ